MITALATPEPPRRPTFDFLTAPADAQFNTVLADGTTSDIRAFWGAGCSVEQAEWLRILHGFGKGAAA